MLKKIISVKILITKTFSWPYHLLLDMVLLWHFSIFMRWGKWNLSNIFFNLPSLMTFKYSKILLDFWRAPRCLTWTLPRSQYHSDVFVQKHVFKGNGFGQHTTNFWLTTPANRNGKRRTVKIHQIIYHVNYSSCELPQEINYVTLFCNAS